MKPTNPLVGPLLTDFYQLTMAYGYWKAGRHLDHAVFELFFRKNPFGGEFTVFAGLEEAIRFLDDFRFKDEEIEFVRSIMPGCEKGFFDWLGATDCSGVKIFAPPEGTVVFPRIPLLRVEGPLAVAQLLETGLLNLVNYPTLIATNAARFRLAAGKDISSLLEFGLRRAQGPDGGVSASRYSYMGGFDATSNVLAGKLFGIPVKGTHAHAYVSSFDGSNDIKDPLLSGPDGNWHNFHVKVLTARNELEFTDTNEGELAAFISYAQAFPDNFLALVDTYDTLKSGVPNFLAVALALHRIGYKPVGVRLDSGDLAQLSRATRQMFREVQQADFSKLLIVASNDINEATLLSLTQQGHEINVAGIGTHLVTCQAQPALGGVYKLVEVWDQPRIKVSEERSKMTIPGAKCAYRMIGSDGRPILDVLALDSERPLIPGEPILCFDPSDGTKRARVIPTKVVKLQQCVWDGKVNISLPPLSEVREYCQSQIASMGVDHLRALNPTPYKVYVSEKLNQLLYELWSKEARIPELS